MTVLVITQWDWDHMTREFDAGGFRVRPLRTNDAPSNGL